MEATISFLINKVFVVGIATCVLFATYKAAFRNSNNFNAMRFFLLGSLAFAFAMPFLKISINSKAIPDITVTENIFNFFIKEVIINNNNATTVLEENTNIWEIISIIYWIGVLIFSIALVIKLLKIFILIAKSERKRDGRYVIVHTHDNHISFSFLNFIFLPEGNVDSSILKHEKSHIDHRHSLDVLIIEILTVIQWFNPVMRLYKRELQSIHEYTADRDVIKSGNISTTGYMTLILQQCTAEDISSIGNSFSFLLTKKRIKMMTRKNKSKGTAWRILVALPIAALLLAANSKILAEQSKPMTNNVAYSFSDVCHYIEQTTEFVKNVNDSVKVSEKMPAFPGGTTGVAEFFSKNINYPQDAIEKGIEGVVFVTFVVEKDGKISDVKISKGLCKSCDEEAMRVVRLMPKWEPGMKNGETVRVNYALPIRFKLPNTDNASQKQR